MMTLVHFLVAYISIVVWRTIRAFYSGQCVLDVASQISDSVGINSREVAWLFGWSKPIVFANLCRVPCGV